MRTAQHAVAALAVALTLGACGGIGQNASRPASSEGGTAQRAEAPRGARAAPGSRFGIESTTGVAFRTYTLGSGATFTRVGLTDTGEVHQLVSPEGSNDHIFEHGYAVCAANPSGGADLVYASTNFGEYRMKPGAVQVIEPNGPGRLPITFVRHTADGFPKFEIRRKFTMRPWEITVDVTVKNLHTGSLGRVRVVEVLDMDINDTFFDHGGGRTQQSVFAWENGAGGRRIGLLAPIERPSLVAAGHIFDAAGRIGCDPLNVIPTPSAADRDYYGMIRFNLGALPRQGGNLRRFQISRR